MWRQLKEFKIYKTAKLSVANGTIHNNYPVQAGRSFPQGRILYLPQVLGGGFRLCRAG